MGNRFYRKYELITKVCPVCGTEFEVGKGQPREKTVCSKSCAMTYFKSGKNHPNYKEDSLLKNTYGYTTVCFRHHEHKCVYCGEERVVGVHHYDGNRTNNLPENLVPLCPTHHTYWHSQFKYLIQDVVDQYVEDFKQKRSILT